MTLDIEKIEQQHPMLGRNKVHDSRSRAFPAPGRVDRSTWKDKLIRVYDPTPNPKQPNGCCTSCSKCTQLNAVGNRKKGRVLDMTFAQKLYIWDTQNDPFEGQMPEDDTGSDGLTSCKGAQFFGVGGEYFWLFGGADEVVQNVVEGRVISVGTRWTWDMFERDKDHVIHATGGNAGGHQYAIRGYRKDRDQLRGRCWWGAEWRDFWIARSELDDLLRDGGDAHFQRTT